MHEQAQRLVCTSTSLNMDDYNYLQAEFENFKNDHYAKCMKLQTELSYLKYLFRKLNKGKSYLIHLLNVQKHTIDKNGLGYHKQTTFSKKLSLYPIKGLTQTRSPKRRT